MRHANALLCQICHLLLVQGTAVGKPAVILIPINLPAGRWPVSGGTLQAAGALHMSMLSFHPNMWGCDLGIRAHLALRDHASDMSMMQPILKLLVLRVSADRNGSKLHVCRKSQQAAYLMYSLKRCPYSLMV